jgi:DNA polymerase III epsilon subunit-like protein
MTKRVYLDTEAGGFEPATADLIEIAYAVGDEEIRSFVVPHDHRRVHPLSAKLNGYLNRDLFDPTGWAKEEDIAFFFNDVMRGATIVGSNPAFDVRFLTMFAHGQWPRETGNYRPLGVHWKHRMIDLSNIAMVLWGLDEPPGMATVAERLGFGKPDHTAAGDVVLLRRCVTALESLARP